MFTTTLPDVSEVSTDSRALAEIIHASAASDPATLAALTRPLTPPTAISPSNGVNPLAAGATGGYDAVDSDGDEDLDTDTGPSNHPTTIAVAADPSIALKNNLARLIELHRLNASDFYDVLKAAVLFGESQNPSRSRFKCSGDDIYNLIVIGLVFFAYLIEYFPSASSEKDKIPDDTTAAIFGVDSVLLNTGLTGLLIGALMKGLMMSLMSLLIRAYQTPTAFEKLNIFARAIDENILPTPWSSRGRAVLANTYTTRSARYYAEMAKPVPSIMLKLLGAAAALCLSAILYQNTENAFFKAVLVRAWLQNIFGDGHAVYDKFFKLLNILTLFLNTPLYFLDYRQTISGFVDTDIHALDARVRPLSYREQSLNYLKGFVATGGETVTALAKMQYILAFMGQSQKLALKKNVMQWLLEQARDLSARDTLDAAFLRSQEARLVTSCAEILRPVDSQAWFKAIALACLGISLVTSGYYCVGIVPLFQQAATNPNLWQFIRSILLVFVDPKLDPKTQTDYGALALSILSVGIFSVIHSKDGFAMFSRDLPVSVWLAEGARAKTRAIANAVIAAVLTILSCMTAAVEANSSGDQVASAMGGTKGATVNAKGSRAPAEFIVGCAKTVIDAAVYAGSSCASGIGSAYTATTSIFNVFCRRRGAVSAGSGADAGMHMPLSPTTGGPSYGTTG